MPSDKAKSYPGDWMTNVSICSWMRWAEKCAKQVVPAHNRHSETMAN